MLVRFLTCFVFQVYVISSNTTSPLLGNPHSETRYIGYDNQPIDHEILKTVIIVQSNVREAEIKNENGNMHQNNLRSTYKSGLYDREGTVNNRKINKNNQINERIIIRSNLNSVFAAQSQQYVLCDIANSLPAVLSFTTNKWNCTTSLADLQICSWRGIVCDVNNNILSLSVLSANTGTTAKSVIPQSIGVLSKLQKLILKTCALRGTIPSILSTLKFLNFINLSNNLLSGTIPRVLGNLNLLQTLYLNNNTLEGTIPRNVSLLASLSYLDLSMNKFSGKFPVFYGMREFTILTKSTSLSNLYQSESIDRNSFNDEDENINNNVFDKRGSGKGVKMSRDMSIVERVRQGLNIKNDGDEWEDNTEIDIDIVNNYDYDNHNKNSNIDNIKFESESESKNEYYDNIIDYHNDNDNDDNDDDNDEERKLKSLQSYYGHTYYTPPVISPPTVIQGLRFLSLYANFLTGPLPSTIVGMKSLKEFHVSYNSLTGTLPNTLGKILTLQSLSLQWNSFTGPIPSSLGSLNRLISLQLFTNRYIIY